MKVHHNCDSDVCLLLSPSSETTWSPQSAAEKTHLATTKRQPLSPRPSLHLSPPARWPLLDLYPVLPSFNVPSVPAHLETHHHQTVLHSFGQSSWLTSPCAVTVVAQVHVWWVLRASMCIFNPFNNGKCSAGFTELTLASQGLLSVWWSSWTHSKLPTTQNTR